MAPGIRVAPSLDDKLALLGGAAAYDHSCACGDSGPRQRGGDGRWIYPAVLPSGRRSFILKVLQQAGCERGCAYCVERHGGVVAAKACSAKSPAGNAGQGLSFTPDELARVFLRLRAAGRVEGLFLSSAIRGGAVASMDRLLATAELLRRRHQFRGYLHLKILPGAESAQVERAMQLATRVSINMEAPGAPHLARIAPGKSFARHILDPMRQVARAQAEGRFRRAGQTTQFVVGAADETDRDIASAAAWLYGDLRLARVYYSG